MQTFKDTGDREWRLSINAATVERVRNELNQDGTPRDPVGDREKEGLDLYGYGMQNETEDPRHILQFRVRAEPVLLTRILYTLCRRQADAAGIDFEAFAESLSGNELWASIAPLEDEIANFTVSPAAREAGRDVMQKMGQMLDKTLDFARAKTAEILNNPILDQMLEDGLKKSAEQFGSLPESPASATRAPTPSGS